MTHLQTDIVSCPWCGTRNAWGNPECRRCGGPLPAIELENAGPQPPPAPRPVPEGYAFHQFITDVTGLVGSIFVLVGFPFLVAFPIVGISTGEMLFLFIGGGLGGLFVGIGVIMFLSSIRSVMRKVRVYRLGLAASGSVIEVGVNYNLNVNGRHPWKVRYRYSVMGQNYEGYAHSWHPTVDVGSPLHVLYLPADPGDNVLYPPLSGKNP